MSHPYVEKLMVTEHNCNQVLCHLQVERAHVENQLTWAESIDVDTARLENNLNEITSCIDDIESWKKEEAV